MDHDWRDIENTVWVQDVPRRPSPIAHEPKADDFPSVLERVLYAVNVAPAITTLVSTDVRRTRNVSYHADQVHESTLTFRSRPCVPACSAHAGTSLASDQRSSRASQGSTRAGPQSSSRDTRPSCASSTSSTRRNGTSRSSARSVPLSAGKKRSDTLTGIVHWGVQQRVARRVRTFCAGRQPRGSAQRAQIAPGFDADARARHAEDPVPDAGLGARQRAR